MPAQGEQHNCAANGNPFEEIKPHISEYTASEIATLSNKCINLANEVFGFNGWSSSIQQVQVDFVDENQTTGKVSLGLSVIVRVTLHRANSAQDIGYGHIENCKGKAPAFEKAKKEGTTDALKRALRNFGNLLGNCVYDKDYVARVTKLKIAPTKWDPENLHRHQDFTPLKKETPIHDQIQHPSLPNIKCELPSGRQESHEDEFGSDDFDEVDFAVPQGDHPDEVTLDATESEHSRRRNGPPHQSHQTPDSIIESDISRRRSPFPQGQSAAPMAEPQPPATGVLSANLADAAQAHRPAPSSSSPQLPNPHASAQASTTMQGSSTNQHSARAPPSATPNISPSGALGQEPSLGFFTARAAETIQTAQGTLKAPPFNPHLESPSIRKTAGVDHSKTRPVDRDLVGALVVSTSLTKGSNIVNPQADKARKVGMPGAAGPLQNRGSYKPPQMKRLAEGGRAALGDVSSTSVNVLAGDGGGYLKKRRLDGGCLEGDSGMLNA
ncbi:MAG: hypothetical protein Q9163_002110 [Psora crenata]